MKPEVLIEYAMDAMGRAYAPYSGYCVGAALLCADGAVYQGCNIENASFSPTICAERTAFAKAVSEGQREFVAIAVCGGKNGEITSLCTPCGVCRQVMVEFCKPDFKIYLAKPGGYEVRTLAQLLPDSFGL
ncbi:MAG: cytidine deaminase [Oscillospiraceae bacterium]|nr:cytidine deaminase [Oscillospiraceae bacterium]